MQRCHTERSGSRPHREGTGRCRRPRAAGADLALRRESSWTPPRRPKRRRRHRPLAGLGNRLYNRKIMGRNEERVVLEVVAGGAKEQNRTGTSCARNEITCVIAAETRQISHRASQTLRTREGLLCHVTQASIRSRRQQPAIKFRCWRQVFFYFLAGKSERKIPRSLSNPNCAQSTPRSHITHMTYNSTCILQQSPGIYLHSPSKVGI